MSTRIALALALTAVVAGGCVDEGLSTKAGGGAEPITLRIGASDAPGSPVAEQIEEFARQVVELSDGQIRIGPVLEAAGVGADDWDQQVARMVVSGELDLGAIPARAWDTEGVTTLRALHAPFLVTSDELLDRVVADEVAVDMLSGLDALGITGLALVPEGLRHVFSFGEPFLAPDDFVGATIRVPTSDTTYALFEALGATPDDLDGSTADPRTPFTLGVADGSIAAAESSFAFAGNLPLPGTATGNVALFPKANAIVANSELFDGLNDEQRRVLRDAAVATRDWAIETNRDDADYAPEYCANGGKIVFASEPNLAALQVAAQRVYAELEGDPSTATMISRIRDLAEEVGSADPIAPCEADASANRPPDIANSNASDAEFPEGTYRMEITVDFLNDAGVDRSTATNHAAAWTLTFDDGRLTVRDVNASTGVATDDHGVYCIENGRVILGLLGDPPKCGDFWSAGWTLDGDQLWFTDIESHHGSDLLVETLFGGQPFIKID